VVRTAERGDVIIEYTEISIIKVILVNLPILCVQSRNGFKFIVLAVSTLLLFHVVVCVSR